MEIFLKVNGEGLGKGNKDRSRSSTVSLDTNHLSWGNGVWDNYKQS